MHIVFDVCQTGAGKSGCGYFADAMIRFIMNVAPTCRYSLFPSFGSFYFDALMPVLNPYAGQRVHYWPRHFPEKTILARGLPIHP